MPTPDTAPAPKPETTRHRIHEVPGQTTPVGKPAPAPKPARQAKAKKAATKAPRQTKGDVVIGMLRRPEGATMAQIEKATDWQAHSVRGFFAGTLKKKKGLAVTSEKADGVRTYRLAPAVDVETPEAV